MSTITIRETLHRQLELLPDELIQEIADFTAFILVKRRQPLAYAEWQQGSWSNFALQNMLRETDNDVEYSLADAQEIYKQ